MPDLLKDLERETAPDRAEVHELIRSLSLQVDPDTLLEEVCQGLRRLFGADLVLVLMQEPGYGDFTPRYSLGFDREALAGAGFSGRGRLALWLDADPRCAELERRLRVPENLDPAERDLLARLRIQVCMPLVSLGRLLGMFLLGSMDSSWRLEAEAQELLEVFASQVALAFENAVLHSQQRDRLRRLYRAERQATAGRLAAGVAHEIRNPLTVISSTVQYLVQGMAADDPRRELAEGLLAEVARVDRTVESLLCLARTRESPRAENDLLAPLNRALLLVEAQARQHGVAVERRFVDGAFRVLCDPDQMEQLFLNLLLNALQATAGGGRISIAVDFWEDPYNPSDRRAQVEIADTGRGIAAEDLERIFEPFFTTKREGSGLGLPISLSIVENHDGDIDIQSEVGRGTTVCLRFPLSG